MWFFQAIHDFLPIEEELSKKINSYCIDSRKVQNGSLFFAIKGQRADGHKFLDQAFQNGAIAAVVEKDVEINHSPMPLIHVDNVQETLQKMAKAVITFWKPKIIAITGSLGKTSTKDFLIILLREKYTVAGTPGNYNSQLTLPLTILNVGKPTEFLVLEMGIDQPGEIDRLLDIAPPTYAILTQLAHVHIEGFGSFDKLASEKVKVFQKMQTKVGVYSQDMPYSDLAKSQGKCKKICTSLKNPDADFYLKYKKDSFEVYKNKEFFLSSPSPFFDQKSHFNLLSTIALADDLKIEKSKILKAIPILKHAPNRLQKIQRNGISFICDAYNANVDSMENALMSLGKEKGRKIAILSDMVELGCCQREDHQRLAQIALQHADILVGLGQRLEVMRPIWKKSKKRWAFFLSYSNMLPYISKLVKKGDVILLKGSRKQALERVLDDLNIY